MLNNVILALGVFFFVIACLFNLRVGWCNVRRGKLHANRLSVYAGSGVVAATAFAVVAIMNHSVWLTPQLVRIDAVPDESVGAGVLAVGILFLIVVAIVGGMVAMLGQLAEGLHLSEHSNRRLRAIEASQALRIER